MPYALIVGEYPDVQLIGPFATRYKALKCAKLLYSESVWYLNEIMSADFDRVQEQEGRDQEILELLEELGELSEELRYAWKQNEMLLKATRQQE